MSGKQPSNSSSSLFCEIGIDETSSKKGHKYVTTFVDMFGNSQITFDKFHIIQHLNAAMDEVRRGERAGNELLKNHRYAFLRPKGKLTEKKREEPDYMTMIYPVPGEAYRLKEMFPDVFDIQDPDKAKGYLRFWCDLAVESGIQPFIKFVNPVKAHRFGIVNYFDSRLTNGILEGINSKFQLAKRRARGFKNVTNYMNMIIFNCGKLNFDYPYKTL